MSESTRKKLRLSPRESEAADGNNSTLYDDLQRLANVAPKPVTPFRRAASANAATPGSRNVRTPATVRTPRGGPATRPISARRAAPTTPHAIRALRERANAARTPGRDRRRSGRVQRETPRDILRDLSRILAKDTRPQPATQPRRSLHSALDLPDIDDGPDPAAPRLSIPLGDMYDDDDSIHGTPPRQSLLPNLPDDADNGTIQSLEFGRRALSETPRMRFAGRRISGFGDVNELGMEGEEFEIDGTFINRRRTMNPDDLLDQVPEEDMDNTTSQLLTGRRGGRLSDVDLGVFGEMEDETEDPTFRFTIPPRMQAPIMEQEEEEDEVVDEDEETRNLANQTILEETILEQDEEEDAQSNGGIGREDETAAARLVDDDGYNDLQTAGWESEPDLGDDDADLQAYREEVSAMDRSLQTPHPPTPQKPAGRQRKSLHVSRFGHEYPSLPASTVKNLAMGFAKSQAGGKAKISKDTLDALVQSSDFFFEQMGEDLVAYAQHGGRKVIEESDVVALMKRTRQITNSSTTFSLAQKLLPRELLQQLRMEPLPKLRRQKRRRVDAARGHDDDD